LGVKKESKPEMKHPNYPERRHRRKKTKKKRRCKEHTRGKKHRSETTTFLGRQSTCRVGIGKGQESSKKIKDKDDIFPLRDLGRRLNWESNSKKRGTVSDTEHEKEMWNQIFVRVGVGQREQSGRRVR